MPRRILAAVVAALVLALAGPGAPWAATVVYDYSFVADTGPTSPRSGSSSGTGAYGDLSGQFAVDDVANLIISMSGTGPVIGTVTALAPPGTLFVAPPPSDNSFSATGPHLTFGGVVFTSSLLGNLTLYYAGVGDYYIWNGSSFTSGALTVSPAAVPEPAGLALLTASLLGLGVARRRKAATQAA